ncbi:pyridoxine/pyridoxamine 5'-phosphate oxidase [Mycobacterium vicinigordonae]|uniref:Pyridoxamine 5'-phosphate oxidase n=1 Tax=Mycobacterium vicinigordonae TaxID=1719132 RepID=A0A7D6HT40_9MYCO|nr:pyridoxal 5'-phosphate synthase [Mycobacterium vicinigordonae]QLL05973.1 pyridoxamine 5'-phosphate oxidase [Mycobacterium vicinigordonae]
MTSDGPPWSAADGGRSYLRGLPVLTGTGPGFDPAEAAASPVSQFATWLQHAVQAGVPEPHAMTLSTVDSRGMPRARVLILKAVDDRGWHFAVSSTSQKGRDLRAHAAAALTFYWPALVRQVRVTGVVVSDGERASAEDFLARPVASRAIALTLRQSQPLVDPTELDAEIDKALRKLTDEPGLVPAEWISYAVRPSEVEFWEGTPDRRHRRLSYYRVGDTWDRTQLWP